MLVCGMALIFFRNYMQLRKSVKRFTFLVNDSRLALKDNTRLALALALCISSQVSFHLFFSVQFHLTFFSPVFKSSSSFSSSYSHFSSTTTCFNIFFLCISLLACSFCVKRKVCSTNDDGVCSVRILFWWYLLGVRFFTFKILFLGHVIMPCILFYIVVLLASVVVNIFIKFQRGVIQILNI